MLTTDRDVRTLLDNWSAAIRARDIEQLMPLYSPDIVYFDLVPPLRYTGLDAIRRNFQRWFDTWASPIGVEIRDLDIRMSGDGAAAHLLHRTSGTLKDGREVGYWVRVTVCCQQSDDGWLITHEHVSLPADFRSGHVVMDLEP